MQTVNKALIVIGITMASTVGAEVSADTAGLFFPDDKGVKKGYASNHELVLRPFSGDLIGAKLTGPWTTTGALLDGNFVGTDPTRPWANPGSLLGSSTNSNGG